MTPEAKADEILSEWTSNNFLHQSAKPSLKAQIVKVIEADRAAMGLKIIDAIEKDTKLGVHSKEWALTLVMDALGIKDAEMV